MKISNILKIIGFCLLATGIVLIVLSFTVFAYHPFDDIDFEKIPQFGALVPGGFICFAGIIVLSFGFRPNFVKMGAKLHNETLDTAGKDIGTALERTADVASPAISKVTKSIKDGLNTENAFCTKCGKSISQDSTFCRHCGSKQS